MSNLTMTITKTISFITFTWFYSSACASQKPVNMSSRENGGIKDEVRETVK